MAPLAPKDSSPERSPTTAAKEVSAVAAPAPKDSAEEEEAKDDMGAIPGDKEAGKSSDGGGPRKTSWAKVKRKVTPLTATAGLAGKKLSTATETPEWIVKERLKVNFYLDDGVSKWHIVHPVANGPRQSPIDIVTGRATLDDALRPIRVNYGKGCVTSVVNTGNSFMVNVDDSKTAMTGGGVEGEYKLVQFHAHWGTTAGAKGSEHTVNGKLYDAELHLVHWNTKYGLMSKAVEQPDGLAVVGIFLEVGDTDHPEFEKVIDLFKQIPYRNMKTPFETDVDPSKFLPDDMSYWYYPGSLTTPPLLESVLWHVCRTPITISKRQLDVMASLRTGTSVEDDHSCIINNFRPPVPLGERSVSLFTGERAPPPRALNGKVGDEKVLESDVAEMKVAMKDLLKEVTQLRQTMKP